MGIEVKGGSPFAEPGAAAIRPNARRAGRGGP